MKIIQFIKNRILANKYTNFMWSFYRSYQLRKNYNSTRETYYKNNLIVTDDKKELKRIKLNLKKNKIKLNKKRIGNLRIFAIISNLSWHFELIPDLKKCGEVVLFDYISEGYSYEDLKYNNRTRDEMNNKIIQQFIKKNSEKNIDILFMYATGYEVAPNIIDKIKKISNVPCICMSLDDKHNWKGEWLGSHYSGLINLAPKFDLSWTTSKVACGWYNSEGGNAIYLPEGFDKNTFYEKKTSKNIPVSFLGAPYGYRLTLLKELQEINIPIYPFGPGWTGYKRFHKSYSNLDVINKSQINLSHGGIGYSNELFNLKKRDFDIPGAGGMYVTSYNHELTDHFHVGKEIICYSNLNDLIDILRYYLPQPKVCKEIGQAAKRKALNSHRWLNRYKKIFSIIGLI